MLCVYARWERCLLAPKCTLTLSNSCKYKDLKVDQVHAWMETECNCAATLTKAHTHLPRLWQRGSGACLGSTKTSSTGCWLNDSLERKRKLERERMKEREVGVWNKVWVRWRSLPGRVTGWVLETHLLHRSLHWFCILTVISSGFKTAGTPPPTPFLPSIL